MKTFARGLGLQPEKVLIQSEFTEPHRAYATSEDGEEAQTRILSIAIKELIKREFWIQKGALVHSYLSPRKNERSEAHAAASTLQALLDHIEFLLRPAGR